MYDYDENGNLIQETFDYPKISLVKTYEYDIKNQVIQVIEEEKGTVRVTKYIYDNVGNRLASSFEVNGKSKKLSAMDTNEQ